MSSPLGHTHGRLLIVRPPVPATVNKAGANYKSEVTHTEYSPRDAYDEWLAICEGIVACGGDALYAFEDIDEPLLDKGDLEVAADGSIRPLGSTEVLGNLDDVQTGRVFTANGPWLVVEGKTVRGTMPHMLPHRRQEGSYYRDLLGSITALSGLTLELHDNPHRWEGMADVAVVGERVVLTYTVAGHYDQGLATKTPRSSKEGCDFAADIAGVPAAARIHAELVYPHFHGDTVHFGATPPSGPSVLVHYEGGLWGDGSERVREALGADAIVPIDGEDAVEAYAGNSRQVGTGVLVPSEVSQGFCDRLTALNWSVHPVPLYELFGKAGGGPACATLYLPRTLPLSEGAPMRYTVSRKTAQDRRQRLPQRLVVDPGYFADRVRG